MLNRKLAKIAHISTIKTLKASCRQNPVTWYYSVDTSGFNLTAWIQRFEPGDQQLIPVFIGHVLKIDAHLDCSNLDYSPHVYMTLTS